MGSGNRTKIKETFYFLCGNSPSDHQYFATHMLLKRGKREKPSRTLFKNVSLPFLLLLSLVHWPQLISGWSWNGHNSCTGQCEQKKCFVEPLKRSFKKSWGQYFWVKISWKLVQWPLAWFSFSSPPTEYSFHLKRDFDQSHISESFMWKTWSPNEVLLLEYDFSKCSHSLQFFRVSKKQEVFNIFF